MGGENHRLALMLGGDFIEFFDKNCAECLKALNHKAVVHDLVADIDRRTIFLDRQHHDLDGAINAGAETARDRKA
jgi:hypothetical protein